MNGISRTETEKWPIGQSEQEVSWIQLIFKKSPCIIHSDRTSILFHSFLLQQTMIRRKNFGRQSAEAVEAEEVTLAVEAALTL